MALHGANVSLLFDGFDMSGYFNEFAMNADQAMHDATVFGNTSHVKALGLKDGKASGTAFFDPTATVGSYPVLKGKYTGSSPASPSVATIALAPNGLAVGNRVVMGYFDEPSLQFKLVLDGLEMMTFAGDADQDGIDFGVSLHALSAETGTVNGTAVDNAAATANGGVVALHCTAIAGAAPSVVITAQHSTDNSTWVTFVTFTATTAANTTQRTEVAAGTTMRRYQRIVCTFGGTTTSITFAVTSARR